MTTMQGPAVFLAQFISDEAPFNSLEGICQWAANLNFKGIQIPTLDSRFIDLKKASLFIIKSFIGPFIMTFFIALFVLLMQFIWLYIDDMLGKGLEWYVIAELLMYASASLVPLAMPLSILLASLMTFGNLGEHFELVSFKAAGISLQKVMQPLIVLVAILSIGAFISYGTCKTTEMDIFRKKKHYF